MDEQKWALSELPCMKSHALAEGEIPPCLKSADEHVIKEIACPACSTMKNAIDHIKSEAYKDGCEYVAWVVTKGPHCELLVFGREPDEDDLIVKYGDDLIAVVPV
jgi:hypothetical protein